jgi:hypothetical protein
VVLQIVSTVRKPTQLTHNSYGYCLLVGNTVARMAAVVIVAALVATVAPGTVDAATSSGATNDATSGWSIATTLSTGGNDNDTIQTLSCTQVGSCSAIGHDGYSDEVGGTWANVGAPFCSLTSSCYDYSVGAQVISCSGPGDCAAAGTASQGTSADPTLLTAFVQMEVNGVWQSGSLVPGLAALNVNDEAGADDVSCDASGNCVLVGGYSDGNGSFIPFVSYESGGTWSDATEITPIVSAYGNGVVNGLSCQSGDTCTGYGLYVNGSLPTTPFVISESGGSWSAPTQIASTSSFPGETAVSLDTISCSSDGNCSVGGSYTSLDGTLAVTQAIVASESQGIWANAIEVPGTVAMNVGVVGNSKYPPDAIVSSLSCTGTGDCTAGGWFEDADETTQDFVATESDGVWQPATTIPGTAVTTWPQTSSVTSVSCSTPGNCAAGGGYGTGSEFVATQTNGTWGAPFSPASAIETPGFNSKTLAVSCAPDGSCAAGGHYSVEQPSKLIYSYSFVSDYTPPVQPNVPGAPTAVSGEFGNTSAVVSWAAPGSDGGTAITNYVVTADDETDAAHGGQSCAWTSGALSCTFTGLTNGDTYTFTVTATNAVGTGPVSAPSPPVVPATEPGAPTSVEASPGNASATVTWLAPGSDGGDAVTAYTVSAADETTFLYGNQSCTWSSGPLSCTVTGLHNGDTYTFTVTATTAAGTGPASASSPSMIPDPPGAPGAPTDPAAIAGTDLATVTWSPPASDGGSPVTNYTVTASDVSTPSRGGQSCSWTTGPLGCTVMGLSGGDLYTFSIAATNASATGPSSGPSNEVLPIGTPGDPTGLEVSGGDGTATVTWVAASPNGSAITAYEVSAADATTSANGGETCAWTTGPLTCTVTGLTDGDTYTFTVTARNSVGVGPHSPTSAAIVPAAAPAAPSDVTVAPGSGSVDVSWSEPADGGSAVTAFTVTASPGGATCRTASLNCSISGLQSTTSYAFSVVATNEVGPSPRSAPSSSVFPYDPGRFTIETLTETHASSAHFVVVAGGAAPGTSVGFSLSHTAEKSCTADSSGQCAVSLVEPASGIFALRGTAAGVTSTIAVYVPLLGSRAVRHTSDVVLITVSDCPPTASVVLTLNGHRDQSLIAGRSGSVAFRIRLPASGRVVARASVSDTAIGPLVVT